MIHIPMSHNVTGFKLKDNPIQVKALAVAVAKIEHEGWILEEVRNIDFMGTSIRVATISSSVAKTKRHIAIYKVTAIGNKPFVLQLDEEDELSWTRRTKSNGVITLPASLADSAPHVMYSITYENEEGFREISTQCWHDKYNALVGKQTKLGLSRKNGTLMHPLDIIPSFALVAIILSGKKNVSVETNKRKETRAIYEEQLRKTEADLSPAPVPVVTPQ